ncbi:hypothetical protein HDV06_007118 [Boothiomyces sp. JEL0866]|nr:hypothetical protein HDV06_007118 [Boothiomyces sp. JEL0866]
MAIVFQSIWSQIECNGVPVSFVVFNETFAPDYYFYSAVGYCGEENFPTTTGAGCCSSSIDLPATNYRQSWQSTYIGGEWDYQTAAYKTANSQSYCRIEFYDQMNFTIAPLFPFIIQAYYLNDGFCHLGFKCTNTSVDVYNDIYCNELIEQYTYHNTSNIASPLLGNISLSITTISNAKNYVDWMTYQPALEYFPTHSSITDTSGLIGYIAGTFIALLFLKSHFRRRSERGSIPIILIQAFYLLEVIGYAYNTYGVLTSDKLLFAICITIHLGLASKLFCNLISSRMLSSLLHFKSLVATYVLDVLLSIFYLLHFTMYLVERIDDLFTLFADLNQLTIIRNAVNNFYYVFSSIFDLIPIIIMLWRILKQFGVKERKKGYKRTILELIWKYKMPIALIILEFVVTFGYFALYFIYALTNLLRGDDSYLGIQGVFCFLDQIQISCTILLYEYLRHFTEELVGPSTIKRTTETQNKHPTVKGTMVNSSFQ